MLNMHIITALIVSSIIIKNISSESTMPPTNNDDGHGVSQAMVTSTLQSTGPVLNSFFVYHPETHHPGIPGDIPAKRVTVKPAHSLTRLAKTLTLRFDPVFSKGYFEPFERRQKPVTLVAFRKKGLFPRTRATAADSKSAEAAELQSPFNDISSFWVDD